MARPCFFIDGKYLTREEFLDWAANVDFKTVGKILPEFSHPDTPFKKTDQWAGLGIKWALRYAAENGFDVVTWTNGETQAERYDLSKQVDKLSYDPKTNQLKAYKGTGPNTSEVFDKIVKPEDLPDIIGKEAAKKIIEQPLSMVGNEKGFRHWLYGEDLKVGGEGMKGFYDQILPSIVSKYAKKWGAKVGSEELDTTPNVTESGINLETGEPEGSEKKYVQVHSVDITPEMKESVMGGQPMFKGKEGEQFTKDVDKRQPELQHYYDSINRGAPIKVVMTVEDAIRDYKDNGGVSQGVINVLRNNPTLIGVYIPGVNQVYIRPHSIKTKHAAKIVWIHENGIHYSIRDLIQDIGKRKEFCSRVYDSLDPLKLNSILPEDYRDATREEQGEEYMAFLVEKYLTDGTLDLKNVYNKEELYQVIDKDSYSDDEIRKIVNTFANNALSHVTNSEKEHLYDRSGGYETLFRTNRPGNRENEGDTGVIENPNDNVGVLPRDEENLPGRRKQVDTPSFKKWFGNSKIVDENGNPQVYYHATADNFDVFQPNFKGLIFAAPDAQWAQEGFMPVDKEKGTSGSVMPVYVKAENPFDYRNPEDVQKLFDVFGDQFNEKTKTRIKEGDPWGLEKLVITEALKNLGYDSFYVTEGGVVNIAVFEPTQLKSATGNIGAFDPNNPDVRFKKNEPPAPPVQNENPIDKLGEILKPKKILSAFDLFREGIQDNMIAWKKIQEKEGLKIKDSSNVYLADNQKNSKALAKFEKYETESFKPSLEYIAGFEKLGKTRDMQPYLDLETKFNEGKITKEEMQAEVEKLDTNNVPRYMIAKHAPERNATKRSEEVEAYRKKLVDGLESDKKAGKVTVEEYVSQMKEIDDKVAQKTEDVKDKIFSGMTDAQAERIVNTFEKDIPSDQIDKFWEAWRKATDDVQKMWVEYGKFDKETYNNNLKRGWKFYVPLRGWEPSAEDIDWEYAKETGKGSFAGTPTMKGRQTLADDPIANMYQIAQSAIKWGEKNRVKQAALRMVRDNANRTDLFYQKRALYLSNEDGTWTEVIKDGDNIYEIKGYDKDGNMDLKLLGTGSELIDKGRELKSKLHTEHEIRNPKQNIDQHEMEVMMNGEKFIVVTRDPKLANEVKKVGLLDMGGFLQTMAKITRTVSALRTAKNPAWVIKNVTRDFQGAILNTWIEQDTKTTALFAKNFANASAYLAKGKEGKEKSFYKKHWDEFIAGGGRTGTTNLQDLDIIKKNLSKEIERINRTMFQNSRPDRVVGKVLGYVDQLGQVTENLTRFAAYVTAREQGKSVVQAVNAAKEISVNFDRKGNWSSAIGSLVGFFNASIQGGTKQLQLAKNHPIRYTASAGVGLAALGYIMSMLYATLWDDDDKKKDYKVQNKYNRFNNMIVAPGDGSWMIPYAQGYRFWNTVGCITYDLIHGKTDATTASYDLVDQFSSAISPIDVPSIYDKDTKDINLWSVGKFISIAEPAISIRENKDYKGAPIHKEAFTTEAEKYTPNSQLYLRNVNPLIKGLTDNIFKLGGGDPKVKSVYKMNGERVPGVADINPSNIEYTLKTLGAGPASFVLDAITSASKLGEKKAEKEKKDKELGDATNGFDYTTVPILNSFYKSKYKGRVDDEYRKLSDWYKKMDNAYAEHKKAYNWDKAMIDAVTNPDYHKYLELKATDEILSKLYKTEKKVPEGNKGKDVIEKAIHDIKTKIVSKYSKP